jgi:two-component system, NarL family, sensor kinase
MDTYETTIYTAILITATVLGCIIVYFAISVFKHQRKYIEMQRLYFLNEVNLLEKERTRIARDLHDEIGPLLSLTKIQVAGLDAPDEWQQKLLGKANENLDMLFDRMGAIAANLTPGILVKKGFPMAIREFVMDYSELHPLKIELKYEVQTEVPFKLSIHLFRIIQEITHNTIKHAQAHRLMLHIKERGHCIYIFSKDDGKGFDEAGALKAEGGLGLRSLRSRTGMMGGKVKCTTRAGAGTEYFFEIPLK